MQRNKDLRKFLHIVAVRVDSGGRLVLLLTETGTVTHFGVHRAVRQDQDASPACRASDLLEPACVAFARPLGSVRSQHGSAACC